jgi:DNA-binding NtrC family response regulator
LISLGSVEVVRIVERDGSRRVQPPDLVIAQRRAETVAIDAAYFLSMETVASSDSTVLLLGDTGTGKELVARVSSLHHRPAAFWP